MDYEIFDGLPEGGKFTAGKPGPKLGDSKYPLAKMAIGQVVFLEKPRSIGDSAACNCSRITGFKFRTRKGEYLGVAGTWVERTE